MDSKKEIIPSNLNPRDSKLNLRLQELLREWVRRVSDRVHGRVERRQIRLVQRQVLSEPEWQVGLHQSSAMVSVRFESSIS